MKTSTTMRAGYSITSTANTDFAESVKDTEYTSQISMHRAELPLYDLTPSYEDAYLSPSATLVGEVIIMQYSSIWNNVVVRGDLNKVIIGSYTSIGDNTVVQTVASLPTGLPAFCEIHSNVTIGSDCTLSSCIIEDDVVVGAKSVICEGAKLEKGSMVAPGSVVPPGRLIPANQLWAGNPVEYVKDLDIGELFANYSLSYVHSSLSDQIMSTYTTWPSNYLLKDSTKEDLDGDDVPRTLLAIDLDNGYLSKYRP